MVIHHPKKSRAKEAVKKTSKTAVKKTTQKSAKTTAKRSSKKTAAKKWNSPAKAPAKNPTGIISSGPRRPFTFGDFAPASRKIRTSKKWENLPFAPGRLVWAGANKAAGGQLESRLYPRVLNETPRLTAIARVAPTVRFNTLAIFLAPFSSRAIDFNNFRSALVHARRTTFFFFTFASFLRSRAFITANFVRNTPSWPGDKLIKNGSARRRLLFTWLASTHETTGHSNTSLPCSSTTRTRLDPQKSPPFLNSSARTLAWRFADSRVSRLRPSSSGNSSEPPTM
jgi:hypothetical protein